MSASQKYKVILSLKHSSALSINSLCKIAHVSKSGFYAWKNRKHSNKENVLINLIKQIFWTNKGKFGYRRITMELKRNHGFNINCKKVYRIMRNENLKAVIRKKNNSKLRFNTQRKSELWTIAPNLLNGVFKTEKPSTIYSTDVTYLCLKNTQRYYLSAIKDLATSEIVAYSVSNKHDIELILDCLKQLKPTQNCIKRILHSDRGSLYSSFRYIQKLKELNIQRSMSQARTPTQNAPIESFFGHFKDEVDYKHCKSFEELKDKIDRYVYYYNTNRYQWNKNMLSPSEVREYLIAYGCYPF